MPMAAAASPLPMAAKRAFRPMRSLSAGVYADQETQRPSARRRGISLQRAHQRGAEPRHRFVIEGILPRLAADTVCTEQSGHEFDYLTVTETTAGLTE